MPRGVRLVAMALALYAFVIERRAGQKRKDDAPQVVHPVEVAETLRAQGSENGPGWQLRCYVI